MLLSLPGLVLAETISVAVASNFSVPAKEIAQQFQQQSQHKVRLSIGSTGKHYAQIINGAPFDIFLAADAKRPALLEKSQHAVADSRMTYALGRLVLWSTQANRVDAQGDILESLQYERLAIANPKLAPYGQAAQEVITKLAPSAMQKLVYGENIAQAFHFVYGGVADLGFIAQSQLLSLNKNKQGSFWLVPQAYYAPIKQQAVLLTPSPAAKAFMQYLSSPAVKQLIQQYGYGVD